MEVNIRLRDEGAVRLFERVQDHLKESGRGRSKASVLEDLLYYYTQENIGFRHK